jgi:hypothetical protein
LKIYTEFRHELKKLNKKNSSKIKINSKIRNLCQKYFRKLLEDSNYTEFIGLLNLSEKFIKSCNFVINGEWIDCREIIYRIASDGTYIYEIGLILGDLIDNQKDFLFNKDIERNLEKITIELMRFETNLIAMESHKSVSRR